MTAAGNNTYGTGGIAGRLAGTVSRSVNYGDVGGTDRYTGGVAGYATTKNKSAVEQSANRGAVSSSNNMNTAALGGVVGYAQFLRLSDAANDGAVRKGTGFQSRHVGEICGREGAVTVKDDGREVPSYTAQPAKEFPDQTKSSDTVTFLADGAAVQTLTYQPGANSVREPAVPAKEGYIGYWDNYRLGNKDIMVKAVYRPVLVRDGDTIQKDGTYSSPGSPPGTFTSPMGCRPCWTAPTAARASRA